jgi:hypothetical protein
VAHIEDPTRIDDLANSLRGGRPSQSEHEEVIKPRAAWFWLGPTTNDDVIGGSMTTLQAIMFGITLALTPSLLALAFFLFREWLISRSEDAGRLEWRE